MDRLDRLSIWAIVMLIISSFVLMSGYTGEALPDRKAKKKKAMADYAVVNREMVKKVKVIKDIIETNNLEKAEVLIKDLLQKFPYEGEPHMVMGDIYLRRQELIKAMHEYREAVDLNPDYLDKNTPLFQGKKLKVVARDALADVEKKIEANPGDRSMREQRKLIYYMERRIAGSCG